MTEVRHPAEPWLSVIGIGDCGLESLGPRARAVVEAGEVLVGGERHLAMISRHSGERLAWRRPLEATFDDLEARRGRRVVVLASGDPMCFGVGEALAGRFGVEQMRVLPAPSTFSLVCARLGWSRAGIDALSLHGRPAAILNRHIAPGARLVVLSHDGDTPNLIARMLVERGFGPSAIRVFEHLDGARERRIEGPAGAWREARFAPLNAVAIECVAGPGALVLGEAPGLPDDAFRSDGMLTKREVRAATLARLAPLPGQCLWDVGAGSGAIGIEWLRAARCGRA
ncbi:MAG: precorrin-6y C5,15-methyltransferase (decarboxylating) subunit CbiE, partial [Geminicoccaceae bacterium]